MPLFSAPSTRQTDLGLAILRTFAGIVFVAHGAQKLFVYGFAGVSGAFAGMGVPMPGVAGPAVALLEFLGGLALIAGFLTRPVGLLLALEMLGALFMVHLAAGFFMPNGYEFAMTLAAVAATLSVTGAGAWSIDSVLARRVGERSTRTVAADPRARAHDVAAHRGAAGAV